MGTIVYVDGFDDYLSSEGTIHGWDANFSGMVAGRVEGQAATVTNLEIKRTVPSDTRYTVGCAVKFASIAQTHNGIIRFYEGSTLHGGLKYNGDSTFSVVNSAGTALATSAAQTLYNDTFFHIEIDFTVGDSDGAFEVRFNKVAIIGPTTGQDTKNGGTGVINKIALYILSSYGYFDDLVLTQGGGFNGDLRCVTDIPSDDGTNLDWTVNTYSIGMYTSTYNQAVNGFTLAWPAGYQIDDVALLLCESTGGEAVTLSSAQGFTECDNSPQATGSGTAGTRIHAYWRRVDATSMTGPTIADPGDHLMAAMLIFRGCVHGPESPIDVTAGGVKASASTSITVPGVTTTEDGDLVVFCVSRDDDVATAEFSGWTNANLVSITELFDLGTTANNGGGIGVAAGVMASAGATGDTTGTVANSINAYFTVALKAAVKDYEVVNETYQNGDFDFLSSSTPGDRDTFDFPAVGVEGTVRAVAVTYVGRKDDAGTRMVATSIRSGGTDYDGTAAEMSTSYAAYQEVWEEDPYTAAAWEVTDIDTAEFGIYMDT